MWNKSEKYKIREFNQLTNLDTVLLEKDSVPQLVKKLLARTHTHTHTHTYSMYPNFSNSDNWMWHKSEKYKIREFKQLTNLDRVLEKDSVPQLVKKLLAFDGTRRFITVFTTAYHLPLSSARSIQSMPPPLSKVLKNQFLIILPYMPRYGHKKLVQSKNTIRISHTIFQCYIKSMLSDNNE